MICPKCKENAAHRAERVSFVDHVVNRFYFKPYSCSECSHRFYALRRDMSRAALREELARAWKDYQRRKQRRGGKRWEWIVYWFVGLTIFGAIYLLMQQRS